jgi:alpha/beta superfamily hydrolase
VGNETFDLPGPAGRLEAILMKPDGPPAAVGIVCHAHPLYGGMMHFKVVFRAAKALQHCGVAALRFNFRGVGRSEGEHDYGRGEQDDVRAALDEAARRFPGLPQLLGGFSFGSSMALRVGVTEPRVHALFALGFPLSLTPDTPFLAECRKPRLFVQGGEDRFGRGDEVRELVRPLPEPKRLVVLEGADHFFSGHLVEMEAAVEEWGRTRPWEVRT